MSTRGVVSIPAECSVLEAARRMRDHHVGCLVVTAPSGQLAGILSERDIVDRVAACSARPGDTLVRDVMTADVATCPVKATIGMLSM